MPVSSPLVNRIKVQLKLAISRLRMLQAKESAVAKQSWRTIAGLLEQGRDESALIRTEGTIHLDITTELYEILELYCELLLARSGLLETINSKNNADGGSVHDQDPGLLEAIKAIIYAAPKTEVKELHTTRALLAEKVGKEFVLETMELRGDVAIPERVMKRLTVKAPDQELVRKYLSTIAETYNIVWPRQAPSMDVDEAEDDGDDGGAKEPPLTQKELEPALEADALSHASPPRGALVSPKLPVHIAPPSPSTENVRPRLKVPGADEPPAVTPSKTPAATAKAKPSPVGGHIPDVNELAARFAALKRT